MSRSSPAPTHSRVADSLRWKTCITTSGRIIISSAVIATGGSGTWLNVEWITTAAPHPGQNTYHSLSGCRSKNVRATIPKIAIVAPCSTAVPSPRTQPEKHRRVADRLQVRQVLHEREPRPHGEALHGGIDEEPDPPPDDEHDDEERLERFLGDRRHVAREMEIGEPGQVLQRRVEPPARQGGGGAGHDRGTDRRGRHQLEAVHQLERQQEGHDRHEGESDVQHGSSFAGWFLLAILFILRRGEEH